MAQHYLGARGPSFGWLKVQNTSRLSTKNNPWAWETGSLHCFSLPSLWNACKLMELSASSWNCIPALGTAFLLWELNSCSWNCMQAHGSRMTKWQQTRMDRQTLGLVELIFCSQKWQPKASQAQTQDFVHGAHLGGENDILESQVLRRSCLYNFDRCLEHQNSCQDQPLVECQV